MGAHGIVPTNVGSAAVALNPTHPHGALFMADFIDSDGQANWKNSTTERHRTEMAS